MANEVQSRPGAFFRDGSYWSQAMRQSMQPQWQHSSGLGALMCLPVIAACFWIGVMREHSSLGTFAIAGAVSGALAAFQKLGDSRLRSRVVLLAGIAFATWLGCVAGYWGWYLTVMMATIGGYCFGAATLLGYGGWWIGLQWMVALLVYGSRTVAPLPAAQNAAAIILGGTSQLVFLSAVHPWVGRWFASQDKPPFDPAPSLLSAFLNNANPKTVGGIYSIRVAAAMALGTLIWHFWGLSNGYWIPMTAAILLRPDFHEATLGGVSRVVGTLLGAGLMSIVLAFARPGPILLGCLLLLSIWACLSVLRVNYALFVAFITAYVVLLFSTLGLPEPIVALHRVEATLVGAAVALAVSLAPAQFRRTTMQQ